jgi:hypothetical protein
MAKATKITPKPVKQPPVRYVLELSEGEADFILALTRYIGGDPANSPRKYSVRIQHALEDATGQSAADTDAAKLASGGIRFEDYGTNRIPPALRGSRVVFANPRYRTI